MKKVLVLTVGILLLFVYSLPAQSVKTPVIRFTGENIVIGSSVAFLEDPTDSLDFNTVRESKNFKLSTTANPDLGLSNSTFWIKFTVENQTSQSRLMIDIENSTLTDCALYYLDQGEYKYVYLSNQSTVRDRKYQYSDFLFDIVLAPNATGTYYLKVKGEEQLILPIILGSRLSIVRSKSDTQLLWGIFIGIVAVMAAYNFLLFIFTKDKSYLLYVLYCIFIGLTQTTLSGYTYHYLLDDSPWLLNKLYIIFPAMAGITAMLFVRRFLETKKRTPKLHQLFLIPITLYLIAMIYRLSGLNVISFRMIDISALMTSLLMYIVSIKISMQGFRPAKYFLIAWTIFFIGIILFSLRNLGLLPYNSFTSYTMGLGTAIELTLLSIALADRINVLKREKELSQAKAIKAANDKERIIREQNISLEKMVNERTAALKSAMEELKQTETQLVQSEKMATLGQLTAGIAHEINNPINFVTSNVSPLKRDVDILFQANEFFQNLALSESEPAEKSVAIQEYSEEQELDFLRTEINHLIDGIHNGALRTSEIVKGLRQFSRLDEDTLKFASLTEGIDSALLILSNQLGSIQIIRQYEEMPLVECYPGKLNQVFLNILSNGAYAVNKQFAFKQGGQLKITARVNDGQVELIFEDNGIGMDETTKNKLFNPFFTTKEAGEGTGLGMSISLTILKKHNGTLEVQSSPGEGSSFIIRLPIHQQVIPQS